MNKRKRSRFVGRNEALIRTSLNRYQGTGIPAYTYDVSTGGARLITSKCYAVGTAVRIRIDLARTKESVTLDGEIKWLKAKEGEDLYELGVGFRNLKSHTILALLRHLYGQNTGIPSSIA
ncbi:MAG: PilZ domain-containing protein [Candidatus Aminicenantes bacterium]|nr:PilZ domain-containing protein [Candidatus Aminicenantes bacterium]